MKRKFLAKLCFLVADGIEKLTRLRYKLRGYRPTQMDLWCYISAWRARGYSILAGPPTPEQLPIHAALSAAMERPAKSYWEMGELNRLDALQHRPVLKMTIWRPPVWSKPNE